MSVILSSDEWWAHDVDWAVSVAMQETNGRADRIRVERDFVEMKSERGMAPMDYCNLIDEIRAELKLKRSSYGVGCDGLVVLMNKSLLTFVRGYHRHATGGKYDPHAPLKLAGSLVVEFDAVDGWSTVGPVLMETINTESDMFGSHSPIRPTDMPTEADLKKLRKSKPGPVMMSDEANITAVSPTRVVDRLRKVEQTLTDENFHDEAFVVAVAIDEITKLQNTQK
jgi:hypothetical protein